MRRRRLLLLLLSAAAAPSVLVAASSPCIQACAAEKVAAASCSRICGAAGGEAESCGAGEARAGQAFLAAEDRRRSRIYLRELTGHFDTAFGILTGGSWPAQATGGGEKLPVGRAAEPEQDLPPLADARPLAATPPRWPAALDVIKLRQTMWHVKQTIIAAAELASGNHRPKQPMSLPGNSPRAAASEVAGSEPAAAIVELSDLWAVAGIKLHWVTQLCGRAGHVPGPVKIKELLWVMEEAVDADPGLVQRFRAHLAANGQAAWLKMLEPAWRRRQEKARAADADAAAAAAAGWDTGAIAAAAAAAAGDALPAVVTAGAGGEAAALGSFGLAPLPGNGRLPFRKIELWPTVVGHLNLLELEGPTADGEGNSGGMPSYIVLARPLWSPSARDIKHDKNTDLTNRFLKKCCDTHDR